MPWAKGEENSQAKLTEDDVRAILADSRIHKEVAYDYDISIAHVWRIRNRVRWKHIEPAASGPSVLEPVPSAPQQAVEPAGDGGPRPSAQE